MLRATSVEARLTRYRPFLTLVLAAVLLAALPAADRAKDVRVADSVTLPAGEHDDLRSGVPSEPGVVENAVPGSPGTEALVAGGTGGPGRQADVASAAIDDASASRVEAPASPASTAPDCDSATGRLRVPTVYAPPCRPHWPEGADNGGATAAGVTATRIKVVALRSRDDTSDERAQRASWADYVAMYEALFRTWGREVETLWYTTTGNDEAAQRADAIQIASQRPFAVLSPSTSLNGDVLVQELASRRIVVCCYTAITRERAAALAPYLWGSILASPEGYALNLAQYVGRRLAGLPARWAGDPTFRAQERKFGLIYPDTWDLRVFEQELARYGVRLTDAMSYAYDSSQYAAYQERARTIVARMRSKGVTTVLNAGGLVFDPVTTREATSQQWFPEWVIAGTGGQDLDLVGRLNDPAQWRNAFGVASLAVGGDPPLPMDSLHAWYWGPGRRTRSLAVNATTIFFTGVHGAGPRLTPETFRDALFAFPPSGGAARGGVLSTQISFGRHGFFPWDDYNQGDDFAEVYWDPQARGKDTLTCQAAGGVCTEAVGKYRYLNGGRRYAPSQWPKGEPAFFDPKGTALWYAALPPGDTPPSYPCNGCPSQGG